VDLTVPNGGLSVEDVTSPSKVSRFTGRAVEHEVWIDCIDDSYSIMNVGPARSLIPWCSA
jgi:hypothetical protein